MNIYFLIVAKVYIFCCIFRQILKLNIIIYSCIKKLAIYNVFLNSLWFFLFVISLLSNFFVDVWIGRVGPMKVSNSNKENFHFMNGTNNVTKDNFSNLHGMTSMTQESTLTYSLLGIFFLFFNY
jgi:hypothetical protein